MIGALLALGRGLGRLGAFRRASRSFDGRLRDPGRRAEGPVLLFVPGWSTSPGVGFELLKDLDEALGARARHYPEIDSRPRPFAEKRDLVVAALDRPEVANSERILLIAHSFGGLLASAALLERPRLHARTTLVAFATPWLGPRPGLIAAGRLLQRLRGRGAGDPELAYMSRDSAEREALLGRLRPPPFALVSLAAPDDELVSPRSATACGRARLDPGLRGHTGPLVDPASRRRFVERIREATG